MAHARPFKGMLYLAAIVGSNTATAQIRASEIGTVSQTIDGTKITLQYSRPRVRGRDVLFGGKAVPWDSMWTPGANWATTFVASKDVSLNGTHVAKGTYAVWFIPRATGEWSVILDPDSHRFHENPPASTAQQLRWSVKADQGSFHDVLTWSFPELRVNGGTIAMQWATTRVSMDLRVEPNLPITLAEAVARDYVGRYQGDQKPNEEKWALIITFEDGVMKGQFEPNDDYLGKWAMIQLAPDTFAPGLYDKKGEIYEVLRPDMIFTFARVNGRVATFEIRNDSDALEATGRRRP